ncbi:type III-B CRISPR module-associated protein Cmr3 [Ktedonobacter racemifer]|uniref:CRISPR-associated protein, Cmr3 family n=1 Tax=Ktedonobacter racemifer DSM 44963 TaxID=485913 RepID=D6TCX7_KTERA|nr:type III-B CRISPR module-associated protein Cmr3 [Ktedonobacter racemifer]EFH90028.1 CRISPR-associated protein, Cmr3 family [Ktedonobacter racemifer DSM 44963]
MRIFIEPLEPLLFRTGRPFEAGESNFAESLFPPTPETLQGALRAAIATHWGNTQRPPLYALETIFAHSTLLGLIGDRSSYGRLRITGLTLGRRRAGGEIERLFPPPASIIKASLKTDKNAIQPGEKEALLVTKPQLDQPSQNETNMPVNGDGRPYALLSPHLSQGYKIAKKASSLQDWLTARGLQSFLNNDTVLTPEMTVSPNNIYMREPRLGIGMDTPTQVTKEGYLYQVSLIRMQEGYGFVLDIAFGDRANGHNATSSEEPHSEPGEELHLPPEGWLTLGGEQRAARFRVLTASECKDEIDNSTQKSGNLLYFATPAYFKHGWLPDDTSILPEGLLTAAINRYQPIGGWSLEPGSAGGKAKATRRCIPAGSVYYFDQPIQTTRPVTEYGWQIGYGITYTGEWK